MLNSKDQRAGIQRGSFYVLRKLYDESRTPAYAAKGLIQFGNGVTFPEHYVHKQIDRAERSS